MPVQPLGKKGAAVLLGAVALALLAGAGCNKNKRATVTGQVKFNNKPVTAGTISFIGKENRTGAAELDAKGNYTVKDAPVGDVTIIITTPAARMGGAAPKAPKGVGSMPSDMDPGGGGQATPRAVVPIPDKYKKVDSSPLKYTVTEGEQTHDIKLEP